MTPEIDKSRSATSPGEMEKNSDRLYSGHGPCALYVKLWCPWCVDAIRWMKAHGMEFELVDVEADRAGMARMRTISGQSLTPTLEMADGAVLADFDTGQLHRFLAERKA